MYTMCKSPAKAQTTALDRLFKGLQVEVNVLDEVT